MIFSEKPNLKTAFIINGDIRLILDLINTYQYTNEEVSEVINIYEPYDDGKISEIEHIICLLYHFPNSKISEATMDAIKNSFPDKVDYINKIIKTYHLDAKQ